MDLTGMTALPHDTEADLRRRILELEQRLQSTVAQRDEAIERQTAAALVNFRLQNELRATVDRQKAGAEILRTIAAAPTDAEQSLQQIAETTARFFSASSVTIRITDGNRWTRTIAVGRASERIVAAVPTDQLMIDGKNLPGMVYRENRQIHIPDLDNVDPSIADFPGLAPARAGGTRTMSGTPLRRGHGAIGALIIHRDRLAPFTPDELALQQNFADQAVIAIENARLFNETQEALERQTATSDILKVIAGSPADVQPVFEAIAESARRVVGGHSCGVTRVVGDNLHLAAFTTTSEAGRETLARSFPIPLSSPRTLAQVARTGQVVMLADVERDADETSKQIARARGYRSMLVVPMLRDSAAIGTIAVTREEPGGFDGNAIGLLKTFADQAVIAIENARLFNETREALERQTATADILKVIASSPSDTQPVFEAIANGANRLLGGFSSTVFLFIDGMAHLGAFTPTTAEADEVLRSTFPRPVAEFAPIQMTQAGEVTQVPDTEDLTDDIKNIARARGYRSMLFAPLMNKGASIGFVAVTRVQPGPFADHHAQLLQTFADQAVIAIENVRLFDEVQAKTRDLEEALRYQTGSANILRVIASSPTDVKPVLKAIVESACELCGAYDALVRLKDGDGLAFGAHHGPLPVSLASVPITENSTAGLAVIGREPVHVHDLLSTDADRFPHAQELASMHGERTILSVPLLREDESIGAIVLRRTEMQPFSTKQISLLQTFADQAVIAIGNVRLFEQVQARTRELTQSLDDLRAAQGRLIQTEKLASLGQLTAGIAHEIKNPLNFVNNFSALSVELTDELKDVLKQATLADKIRTDVEELTGLLKDNLGKVVQHGKRADSIVKSMLLHSREGSGEHRPADVNALVDESLNLAYHGARAEKPQFNVTLMRNFDPEAGMIEVFPQEITRVLLNLISNGFYAVTKRKAENGSADFEPLVTATTKGRTDRVEICIRDNGTGIPPDVKEKMFNPFFTTKPAGEGTGLGLSMSHDIVVKQHGGTIEVTTEPGEFTEFTIILPRTSAAVRKSASPSASS
jgi:two-component system NtrC family sensor kinase